MLEIFNTINNFCVTLMDYLLGWSLVLPRFVVLLIVAVGTAILLTIIRKYTSDQDRLRRAKQDKARLKKLLREAKARSDKEAVARHRQTIGEIGMLNMKAEIKPLFASLIPIALIAMWAFSRIGYEPPLPSETVVVRAYYPLASIGGLSHMLPQKGLDAEQGWIQKITADKDSAGTIHGGVARWNLRCTNGGGTFTLPIRYHGQTFEKALIVDGQKYAEPVTFYDPQSVVAVQLHLKEYKPLGVVPGIPWWYKEEDNIPPFLPPWIIGYLIIVIPLAFILKPLMRVY